MLFQLRSPHAPLCSRDRKVGTLDQGFWPDGIYSAPSVEAMAYDVNVHKRLGMNAQRHHMKVEPRVWYHQCDVQGLMVWQDMPAGGNSVGNNWTRWLEYVHELPPMHVAMGVCLYAGNTRIHLTTHTHTLVQTHVTTPTYQHPLFCTKLPTYI